MCRLDEEEEVVHLHLAERLRQEHQLCRPSASLQPRADGEVEPGVSSYASLSPVNTEQNWELSCSNIPRSLDHLSGLARRKGLQYQAEMGLKEAFQSLAGKKDDGNKESVEKVGARIAYGLAKVSFFT